MNMDNIKKRNILIVHNYYQIPGGEDTVVANEKKMLEDHGHKVILYSRNNTELNEMSKLKKAALPVTTIFNPRTYREIKKLIKLENIEIVHVHNTLNLISPAVYYAARAMHVPVVQTMHNFRMLCPGATFYRDGHICEDCAKYGLKCAVKYNCYRGSKIQTLACVISTWFHRMIGIYGKINYICLTEFNKNKLLLLNKHNSNIVDSDRIFIKPNFTYQGKNHKSDDYYLFIGRVEEIKGLTILLDAFRELPKYIVKIAGTGSQLEYYKEYAKDLKNVEFLGFLNREHLNETISHAKAIIVTSQWYETFGMIIAEAYANCVPVISGDIGNIGILVEDGKTGLKFQYNSAEELKKSIQKFEDLSDISALGKNAYKKYEDMFSEASNYKLMMDIYDRLKV